MNRLIVGLVAVLIVLVGVNHVNADLVFWSGNGHWYEAVAVPEGILWQDARDEANNRGGYLACIGSEAENNFVFSLVDDEMYWHVWADEYVQASLGPYLGGYQPLNSIEPDGGWTWVSGEPWSYTNWDINQPDNVGHENSLHFHKRTLERGATWNDWCGIFILQPNHPIAYVVEYETIPEPSCMTLLLFGLASSLCLRRRK